MLEVIVFVCGAALMGLEFLAARMFAPMLGSSLFVWGAVVSVVMVALSLGYWIGGQLADRFGTTRTLAPVVATAGLFTVLVPLVNRTVLPVLAGLDVRAGSLAASLVVFFLPALMLAMVSPLGIRLAAGADLGHIGRTAGQLSAISTAGSIVGTLATAFWLIPILSLDGLVVGIGCLLFATSLLAIALPSAYSKRIDAEKTVPPSEKAAGASGTAAAGAAAKWFLGGRGYAIVTVAFTVIGVAWGAFTLTGGGFGERGGFGMAPDPALHQEEEIIYSKDTQYHRLLVTEDSTIRHLRFDRSHQSAMFLDDTYDTPFSYPKYLHVAVAAKPDSEKVLVVGLGGGSFIKRAWRDYPNMTIDVVEIDPKVILVASKYFDMPEDERIRIHAEDGRRFLAGTDEKYDLIVMDAYYADALPSHLVTAEFFEEAKAHLTPDGVLAYNMIGSVEGTRSELFRSMYKTADSVWENLWVFPIGIASDGNLLLNRNIIVLATDNRLSNSVLLGRIENGVSGRVTVDGFNGYGADLYDGPIDTTDVPLLTDQHAPTDSLIKVN
ncbi:MAG: fused MFS/spermidine synthase [Coriobacteriia bacterium]|nr:fused MFS/spermidine synthase [Coriobacteriia bacterium]